MIAFALIVATCFFNVRGINVHQYEELQHHEIVPKKHIPIVKQSFQQDHHGYKHSYETGNGIHAQESGYFKNKGDKEHETLVQQGTITYHDEHGHPITLSYIADEHGFQPQGAHLPTPPPEIQKHLQEDNQHVQYQPQEQEAYQFPQEVYEQQGYYQK